MILEFILAIFFFVIIMIQKNNIRKIVIRERKTIGMYIVMVLGVILLLFITFNYGRTILHLITGLLVIELFLRSLYVTGVSKDSFYYSSPPHSKRFIGQKLPFEDVKDVRLETYHKDKIVVRFVAHSSERLLNFSKKDSDELSELLDYNFQTIAKKD